MVNKNQGLRFLFIIDSLAIGGAQRQIVNLALGLQRRGYKVDFFCYAKGDDLADPLYKSGISVYWNIKKNKFSPSVIYTLNKIVRDRRYDAILSFLTTPNFYAIISGRFFSKDRIPVICSERRVDLPEEETISKNIVRSFYRFSTKIITNSYSQKVLLANRYPWMTNRLETIYNGYDLDIFSPALKEPFNDPINILAIASVLPRKNGLCLVEALNILKIRYHVYPQIDWIGRISASEISSNYFNLMNKKLQTYDLVDQWNWLDLRDDIVDQLRQHDVFIHPSFNEGLPNVVCEALACGRPVIISNVLDHSRLVQNGITGYLFDYSDPADLAEKIKMFIDLPFSYKRKMGDASRKFAETYLSIDRFIDEYEQLFLWAINEGH